MNTETGDVTSAGSRDRLGGNWSSALLWCRVWASEVRADINTPHKQLVLAQAAHVHVIDLHLFPYLPWKWQGETWGNIITCKWKTRVAVSL